MNLDKNWKNLITLNIDDYPANASAKYLAIRKQSTNKSKDNNTLDPEFDLGTERFEDLTI